MDVLIILLFILQLSRKDYLCPGCYTNLQRISENVINVIPALEFGHKHVCFGCGMSIAKSRTYPVPLQCPERNIILSWTLPHLV